MCVVEFKRELFVPCPRFRCLLAVFQFHFAACRNLRSANVDSKGSSLEMAARRLHLLYHQAAQLCFDCRYSLTRGVAGGYGHVVISFGQCDGEVEGFVAGAQVRAQGIASSSINALNGRARLKSVAPLLAVNIICQNLSKPRRNFPRTEIKFPTLLVRLRLSRCRVLWQA